MLFDQCRKLFTLFTPFYNNVQIKSHKHNCNVTAQWNKLFASVACQRKKYVTSSLFRLLCLLCDWSDPSLSRIRIGNRKKRPGRAWKCRPVPARCIDVFVCQVVKWTVINFLDIIIGVSFTTDDWLEFCHCWDCRCNRPISVVMWSFYDHRRQPLSPVAA